MGNEVFNESHPYEYAAFKTESKPGESGILVRFYPKLNKKKFYR